MVPVISVVYGSLKLNEFIKMGDDWYGIEVDSPYLNPAGAKVFGLLQVILWKKMFQTG